MRRPALFDDRSPYVDRFGLLLTITVATIVALSLLDVVGSRGPLVDEALSATASAAAAVTLLLALRAAGLARRWQRAADLVLVLGLVTVVVLAVLANTVGARPTWHSRTPGHAIVALAVAAPLAVMRRLLQHRRIHRGTLFGAVSAYLLIPVAFFYAFLTLDGYDRFFGRPEPSTSFMYFSLTTLTTAGFGDLVPATDLARLLTTTEAVVGQIYLVTFVAMLVGLFAASWRDRQGDGPPG